MYRSPEVKPDPRRALPAVDRLADAVAAKWPSLPAWAVLETARRVLAEARERLAEPVSDSEAEANLTLEGLSDRAGELAAVLGCGRPRRVVNATGIPLHTNLGRAPLAPGAVQAIARVAASYSDLELDLETGRRGDRLAATCSKLASWPSLTGGARSSNRFRCRFQAVKSSACWAPTGLARRPVST